MKTAEEIIRKNPSHSYPTGHTLSGYVFYDEKTVIRAMEEFVSQREASDEMCNTLYDYVVTEQSLQCEICNHEDYVFDIDLLASCDHFYGMGWRIIQGTKYCPICAKKHEVSNQTIK